MKYSEKNLILTSQKRQHKKLKRTLLIHFVLAMLSTFLGGFNFGHFTFPHRTQNPKKLFYCIKFRPPCAIWLKRKRLGRIFNRWPNSFQIGRQIEASSGQLGLNMLYKKWLEKWKSYRYRFVPWIALNLRKRLENLLFVYSLNKPVLRLQYDILS